MITDGVSFGVVRKSTDSGLLCPLLDGDTRSSSGSSGLGSVISLSPLLVSGESHGDCALGRSREALAIVVMGELSLGRGLENVSLGDGAKSLQVLAFFSPSK